MTTQRSYAVPQARRGKTLALRTLKVSCLTIGPAVKGLLARALPTYAAGRAGRVMFAVLALLFLAGSPAQAVTYTATPGSPFNWSDTTRWTPTGSPISGDTAVVSSSVTINVDVNVNGVILNTSSNGIIVNVPSGGTLKLEASSTLASSNSINVTGGTLAFDTGTTTSSSNINLNTGTVNLIGNLSMVSGTGTFTWNGGQITGSGTLTNPLFSTLAITGTGGGMTISGAKLDNFGPITYTSNTAQSLSINSGAHIKIESGGSIALTGDDPIQSDLLSSPAIDILSGGSMTKSSGTSINVGVPVNNGGIINPGTLTINLLQGGTHTGTFTLSASTGVLGFNSTITPHTFNAGSNVTGGSIGVARFLGGTSNVNAALVTPNVEVDNGATLAFTAAGSLSSSGILTWKGGTFSGPGSVSASGTADLTSLAGPPTLADGITFSSSGTFNYNPTQSLTFKNTGGGGATFHNTGTFDIQGSGTTTSIGAGHAFNQTLGTVKKTLGAGAFIFNVPYNQSGGTTDVQVAGGAIGFSGGGSLSSGQMQSSGAGATVDFNSTPAFTISGGTLVGASKLGGGTLTVNSVFSAPATFTQLGGTLNGTGTWGIPASAVHTMTGGQLIPTSTSVATNGQLTLDTTASSLTLGPLTVNSSGNFLWQAGTNAVVTQTGAAISNSGIMDLRGAGIFGAPSGGTLTNTSTGTLKKTVNAGSVTLGMPVAISGGTLSTQSGTLFLTSTATVTHAGSFDVQAGTGLQFSAGNHSFVTGASFTAGTGTVFVASPAVVNLSTNVSIPTLQFGGGQITGTGNLQTTGSFSWTGGTMDGTGTTTITSGAFSLTTGPMTLGRNLSIPGNTTFNIGGNALTVQNAVTITNGGTFDVQGGDITCNCTPTPSNFANNGTLQRSTNAGTSNIGVPVSGSGFLHIVFGALQTMAAASFNSTGIAAGGTAYLAGSPTTIGTVTGGGILAVPSGATTISGAVTLNGGTGVIDVFGGSLTLNGTTATDTLAVAPGTLGGSGNIGVGTTFVFSGGTLNGSGTLSSNGTGTLNGANGAMTLSKQLINNGTMTYSPASPSVIMTVTANTNITNNNTFLHVKDDLLASGTPFATFTNNGSFTATPTGTVNFGPVFANGNDTTFTTGTMLFTNGYSQTGPMTYMNGGSIGSPAGGIQINGGSMEAFNSIIGDLVMNGTLTIEDASGNPATLNVTGNYTQSGTALLNIKLNGTGSGTTYDHLAVTGNVTLAGTLTATLGYSPVNGDAYKPLTFGGRPGGTDFTTKNFPPIPGGGSFSSAYIAGPPQALQITASTTSADLSLTQSGPSTALVGQNVTIILTVANAGPSSAAAQVADTFTNAAFVSATASGAGACTGTGPVNCSWTGIASGGSETITLVLNANATGVITNNASVSSSTTPDPNTGNNTASPLNVTVGTSADISVTKIGPGTVSAGSQITYAINVINNGPSPAANVQLADPTPAGTTLVSVAGACTGFPCSLGTMASGSGKSVSATYSLNAGTTTVTNVASVTTTSTDPNPTNNSASVGTAVGCPSAPGGPLPGNGTTGIPVNGTLFWSGSGTQFKVYLGPVGSGCNTLAGTTSTASFPYSGLQPATTYEWRIEAVATSCPTVSSACFTFTTAPSCAQPPALTAPASGATLGSPITFSWVGVPGATDYHLFASVNGGASLDRGTTSGTTLSISLPDGLVVWYVVANVPTCGQLQSSSSSFTVCNDLPAPVASVVANAATGQSYDVTWDAVPLASRYDVDEATDENFTNATTKSVTTNSATYQHTVGTATAFFYRVRAFGGCKQQLSANSNTARVVLVPVAAPATPGQSPNANVPVGSKLIVVQQVFIPGIAGGTFPFTATVDKPWLTIQPSSGSLPPSGVTLQVFADPTDLPNGTFTGTVTVVINNGGSGAKAGNGSTSVGVPVSISLVTPIKPGSSAAPPANALVIPSVGHLDGVNSKWQSDVRLTNPTATKQTYALTFTPSDPSQGVKTTTIVIAANDTTALDDIVRNWYGVGTLGESANGVLLIVPASGSGSGKGLESNVSVNTVAVASSRTYNVTSNGTLGQYIPAIPFASFIGKAAAALSLQQVAQNDAFRTNLGLVEAAGSPATALITVFSNDGAKLLEQSVSLKANEQKQLNSFLAANNISLDDGRIEVQVTDGNGKITAYASRVDNLTGDPLLVSGVSTGQATSNHFVLPGVAAINNGLANWRSDVRIYNAATSAQTATLTFYPLNSSGSPLANSLILQAGEVKSLDDIVKSYYGLDNGGGALHVTTSAASPLVVTGRTYNQTTNGSYGQFIPAVTANDAVGNGDRALNVLQVEDSVRYRTNLGIAEVTGKPVTVEVSVFLPDSKVIPKVQLDLQGNDYRQTAILHDLGLANVYNARISVKVIGGDGRITAYGSIIDMETQDPTYVPAQ